MDVDERKSSTGPTTVDAVRNDEETLEERDLPMPALFTRPIPRLQHRDGLERVLGKEAAQVERILTRLRVRPYVGASPYTGHEKREGPFRCLFHVSWQVQALCT